MKKEKTKRNKILGLLLGLVIFTGISSIGSTFAWWSLLKQEQPVEIAVGERLTLAVSTADVSDDGYLIPLGETKLSGQVYYVTTSAEVKIAGSVDFSLYEVKITDEGRAFKTVGNVDKTALYKDYFAVRLNRTAEGAGGTVLNTATPYVVEDISSLLINVNIEFSIIVPADFGTKTPVEKEVIATDLSKGTFTITLGFELLEK